MDGVREALPGWAHLCPYPIPFRVLGAGPDTPTQVFIRWMVKKGWEKPSVWCVEGRSSYSKSHDALSFMLSGGGGTQTFSSRVAERSCGLSRLPEGQSS